MLLNPYRFTAGGGPSIVLWSGTDKHADISLSNGSRTATRSSGTGNSRSLRATSGKSSGKWYWEIAVDSAGAFIGVGIANTSAPLGDYIGADAGGFMYASSSGNKFNAGASSAYGSTYTDGDVIMVALDMTAGKVWFGKNGIWQASGDPAAGTSPAFSSFAGTMYPAATLYSAASSLTGRFNPATQSYGPPSGFIAVGA